MSELRFSPRTLRVLMLLMRNGISAKVKIYLKHADVIDRVTFWGLTDADSWKNGWPMPGRTDYPLAIDRNYQPKPFVDAIIKLAMEEK